MNESIDAPIVVARFFTYALAIALFGAACFPLIARARPAAGRRRAVVSPIGLAVAALAYLGLLARELSQSPGWPPPGVVLSVVTGTGFGAALAATAICALGAAGAVWFGVSNRWLRLGLSGAALAALAFVGHAADGEGPRGAIRLAIMAMHLLTIGAWLGALAPLVSAALRNPEDAHDILERFGRFGVLAVFLVIGTGLGSLAFVAVQAQGGFGPMYLRTLGIKLACVAGLLGAAAVNRWWLTPRLAQHPERALPALRFTVLAEQAFGLAAIACVAVLGQTDPAM